MKANWTTPSYDATPPRMGRSPGKGYGGHGDARPPAGAKFGTGEGTAPTRMDRKVGKGYGGHGDAKPPASGPCRMSRKVGGGAASMGKDYGVGGCSHTGSKGYGV